MLIDIFTKKVWIFPLKTKRALEMKTALATWLQNLDSPPDKLVTDRGLEFTNRSVKTLLQQAGVEWEPANGTLKAAIAERANKTIQILIYKYLTQQETVRYIDVLDSLVSTYNSRPHRTLDNYTPDEADQVENENVIKGIFLARYGNLAARFRRNPRFAVGDLVRVKTDPHKISQNRRAYAEQFTGEYFRIVRINRTLPVPMYYLRSLDTEEFIQGAFYAEELQRQRGDIWKIEAVLDERVRNGVPEIFVKWKYFSPRWNSWVPRRNVVQQF